MKTKKLAKILSKICFRPHDVKTEQGKKDYAVQLFIEAVVLPKYSYSVKEMEKYILTYLKGSK
jgi:hypothetical protein